jgi:hypothetical protein
VGLERATPTWIERLDLDRYWTFALPATAAVLTASGLIVMATFLPGDHVVADDLVFLSFVLAIPLHFGTMASALQLRRTDYKLEHWPNALFAALPRAQRLALLALIVLGMVIAGLSIVQLRGEPERHGDRYYLRNKSDPPTEVSRGEYIEQRKLRQRALGAGPAVFTAMTLGTGLGYRRRHVLAPPPNPWPAPDFHLDPDSLPPPRSPPA